LIMMLRRCWAKELPHYDSQQRANTVTIGAWCVQKPAGWLHGCIASCCNAVSL
jgi:hypothetical protein